MANFTQGSLSIEEYFSGFQTLWADYCDIVYANVPTTALSLSEKCMPPVSEINSL